MFNRLLSTLLLSYLLCAKAVSASDSIHQQLQDFSFPENCARAPSVPAYDDRNVDWDAYDKQDEAWRSCLINAKSVDARALKALFVNVGGDLTQSPINQKLYPKYPRNCQCSETMDKLLARIAVREKDRFARFKRYMEAHEERGRQIDAHNKRVAEINQRNHERAQRQRQQREREATYRAIWQAMANSGYMN